MLVIHSILKISTYIKGQREVDFFKKHPKEG